MANWYSDSAPLERRTFWASFGGWALDALDVQMFSLAIPALIAAFHITKGEAGLLGSVTLFFGAIGGWVGGALGDRFGRVKALQITIATFALATFASAFAMSYSQLLVLKAIQGLGFGAEWAVGAALMAEVIHPQHRGKALGLVQSGFSVGWALAAVLTGLLLANLPASVAWRSAFWIGVVPALVVLAIRRYIPEPELFREMKKVTGGAVVATWHSAFHKDVRRASFLAALLVTGLQASSYAIMIWLPTMLVQVRHLPVSTVALMVTMMSVGSFIGQVGFAYLNDSLGRRSTAIAFCLFSALLTGCYLFIPLDAWLLAALGLPVGMGINGAFAGMGPMLSELFPTQIRTTCMGFSYNVGKSVGALSVAAVGVVAERMGMVGAIAVFCFLGYFCALLALSFLPETRGRDLTNVALGDDSYDQLDLLEQASPTRR
jgi:MFS family permease